MTRVHVCHWSNQRYALSCAYFLRVLTVLHAVEAPSSGTHYQGRGLTANWNDHRMRRSLSAGGGIPGGRKKLPISLGFKCAYCGEFGSRAGIDCHRRHRNSIGTPCADPVNSMSMSLTQRGDSDTGNLRLHGTLGVCTLVLPHHVQTLFCHFATRTLSHQNSCNNVYKVNNVDNSVIIVHNGTYYYTYIYYYTYYISYFLDFKTYPYDIIIRIITLIFIITLITSLIFLILKTYPYDIIILHLYIITLITFIHIIAVTIPVYNVRSFWSGTNQGSSSAKTLMTHSLNKEASQLLCEAMQCRVEDGEASAEAWKDSNGRAIAPDHQEPWMFVFVCIFEHIQTT